MQCELLFENRIAEPGEDYLNSGNVLLDRLFGANIHHHPGATDMNAAMEAHAAELKSRGRKPYIIPGGGSNPIGALGYVNCALEILQQANEQQLHIHHIVHATGSAGTQAGLVTGLCATHSGIPVLGIGVNAPREVQEEKVYQLALETADYIGAAGCVRREDVIANCDYIGDGYGVPTDGMCEALLLLARLEGLLFDPVYSGKGLAGMIDLIKQGQFKKDENLLFIHTGGSVGLFGYLNDLL
jgi:L-cysteate sulfo-lyase